MGAKLPIAVVGVGRMGKVHAANAANSSLIDLIAIVDSNKELALKTAEELKVPFYYDTIEELASNQEVQASVIASPTDLHIPQSLELLKAGHYVMLEKPLSDSLESANKLMEYLGDSDDRLMQGMMRRFDPGYSFVKLMMESGYIGNVFKIISILEDSAPPPAGYVSPGILIDMAIHNADEVLWLMGKEPIRVTATGSNLYSKKLSSIEEDFDDARVEIEFEDDSLGMINVSRNHVAGYHIETTVFGSEGRISLGHFDNDTSLAKVIVLGKNGKLLNEKYFDIEKPNENVPEFISRFMDAYKNELNYFARQCLDNKPFNVTQVDGYKAMQIVFAGKEAMQTQDKKYINLHSTV